MSGTIPFFSAEYSDWQINQTEHYVGLQLCFKSHEKGSFGENLIVTAVQLLTLVNYELNINTVYN